VFGIHRRFFIASVDCLTSVGLIDKSLGGAGWLLFGSFAVDDQPEVAESNERLLVP